MAIFRCKKCSHSVGISLYRGVSTKELRHGFCGGELERVTIVKPDKVLDDLINIRFKSKSGIFKLEHKIFVQV